MRILTMKKSSEKSSVSSRAIEKDLKALFESEEYLLRETGQDELEPNVNLDQALQVFDQLRTTHTSSQLSSQEPKWTHPSIFTLGEGDPVSTITLLARKAVLEAIENGWSGPPY